MNDKTRHGHRHFRAPQGFLPNWAVAVLAVAAASIAVALTRLS